MWFLLGRANGLDTPPLRLEGGLLCHLEVKRLLTFQIETVFPCLCALVHLHICANLHAHEALNTAMVDGNTPHRVGEQAALSGGAR